MNGRAERVAVAPSADAPLTPDQQCTLQAIVRAKVEALPLGQQNKGTYPKVWSRFNNHFRLARYSQLPQSRMSEAVAYLTRMEILPPAPEQLCLPAAPAVLDEQAQKVQSLVNEVKQRGNELMAALFMLQSALRFRPVKMDSAVPDLSKSLERTLPQFGTAISMNVSALSSLLEVYIGTLTCKGEEAAPEELPIAFHFNEAPYLEFAEECRQAHTKMWNIRERTVKRANELFTRIASYVIFQKPCGTPNRALTLDLSMAIWSSIYEKCDRVMTGASQYMDDEHNPAICLLNYVKQLNQLAAATK